MRAKVLLAALIAALAPACVHAPEAAGEATHAIAASYPEGPLWQGDKLYYAEMGADRVSLVEGGTRRTFFSQEGCGPTALAPYGEGFLVLCHIAGRVVAIDAQGQMLRAWDRDGEGHRLRDPNDAYADGHGGVYFSDPGLFARNSRVNGFVMHLSAGGELARVAGPLWYPNGVFVDGATLYVTEHMAGRILRFPIAEDGALGAWSEFVNVMSLARPARYDTGYAETGPDGLERGPNGDLFVAIYGEGRILRLSPEGELVGMIETPTRYLTNIAFNATGAAVTTGSFENLTPPYPGEVRFHSAASLTRAPD